MEGLKTTYKISLDFYIRKIITVNAKQLDSDSRIINITCTENGKKIVLDSSTTSAFVRFKKSDGFAVLNEVEILDDGTANLELTQQMLAVEGRQLVDIVLINDTGLSTESVESILNSETMDGVSVLSTMSFYVNTEGVAIDSDEIESSYEYNALVEGLGKIMVVEKHMNELDKILTNNENQRLENETIRQESEEERTNAETQRENSFKESIELCNSATNSANTATKLTNEAIQKATEATSSANTATENANEATDRANIAAEACESMVDQSGIIMKAEKGVANGVASLDEKALVPNEQINTEFEVAELKEIINSGESFEVILGKIAIYMQTINAMLQKSSDSTENVPILLASSHTPVEGDFTGASYNTGVTINPSEKSINSEIVKVGKKVIIGNGNATLELENNGEEKMIKLSFAE